MTHVMLDLETFGTDPNSAIIQIGACSFHPNGKGCGETFFCNVTLQSSILAGLTLDEKTIRWWMDQGESAQAALANLPIYPLPDALIEFSNWLATLPGEPVVWSHGAAFDIPLLQLAYKLTNIEVPWNYRNTRDTRTVFALAKERGWLSQQLAANLAHNAKYDALHQAAEVQRALACINGSKVNDLGEVHFSLKPNT